MCVLFADFGEILVLSGDNRNMPNKEEEKTQKGRRTTRKHSRKEGEQRRGDWETNHQERRTTG